MSDLDDIDLGPEDFKSSIPLKKVPYSDVFEASHAGDVDRLHYLLDSEVNVNAQSGAICSEHTFNGDLRKLLKAFEARPLPLGPLQASLRDTFLACKGLSLPEQDHIPAAMLRILQISLANSSRGQNLENSVDNLSSLVGSLQMSGFQDDLADVCVRVDKRRFRCHQVVLASRSEYFKARLSHMNDFLEDPDQAEEMFDASSRYLLFPLKRAVADALLPHLEMVPPAELCHWLILSVMYGVSKIQEYCLDEMACNFETFAETPEFQAILLTLPPPSGDSSLQTTAPSAPGAEVNSTAENLLDDL
ncbi:BTB POZ domain-containing At2g04740 [Olea europaea subsp. europaea]|uniref:BTB POZ domain-containing At2g04740 n=1 Tax=Olea europaea subsp. europaea TaxID=158383 RepID=A0A8S0TNA5_OLEEU|nr:BTB POZ domain-containing At2g04740 [Olea europaea subsp. europaea]